MSTKLTRTMETEIAALTRGETLKWAGRTSAGIGRLTGTVALVFGAVMILATASGAAASLGTLFEIFSADEPFTLESGWTVLSALFLIAVFIAGLYVAGRGLFRIVTANRIVWAVTDRRLIRLVAGSGKPPMAWEGRSITGTDLKRGMLLVGVHEKNGEGGSYVIYGPPDLETARDAIEALRKG